MAVATDQCGGHDGKAAPGSLDRGLELELKVPGLESEVVVVRALLDHHARKISLR